MESAFLDLEFKLSAKWDARITVASSDERWGAGIVGRILGDEMTIQHACNIVANHLCNLSIGRTVRMEAVPRF